MSHPDLYKKSQSPIQIYMNAKGAPSASKMRTSTSEYNRQIGAPQKLHAPKITMGKTDIADIRKAFIRLGISQ